MDLEKSERCLFNKEKDKTILKLLNSLLTKALLRNTEIYSNSQRYSVLVKMTKVIQQIYKRVIFFHFWKCAIKPEPHSIVRAVNYDSKEDCPNSRHFVRSGAWGHHNWPPREADRTGIRFPWREAADWGTEQPWSHKQMDGQARTGATTLVTVTKLSPHPSGSIPGPQLSRKQEISEVTEVTLITIKATQLPWEEPECPLSCLWAYCSFNPTWRRLTTTLLWPCFHRSEDQSWPLRFHSEFLPVLS